jgi:hypothetical protein
MTTIRKSKSHETVLWLDQGSEGRKTTDMKDKFELSQQKQGPTYLAVYKKRHEILVGDCDG